MTIAKYLLWFALLAPLFAQDIDTSYQNAVDNLNVLHDGAVQLRSDLSDAEAQNSQLQQQISNLNEKLASLQNVHIFDHLEDGQFSVNCGAIVGGSGNATGSFFPSLIEVAQLSIQPAANQYGDCFFKQSFGAHPELSKFTYDVRFLFPTAQDAQASQALELDLKQPIGGLMFQFAAQIRFSGLELRYWTPSGKWQSFSPIFPVARFLPSQWHELIVIAHHDSSEMYLDSYSLDGVTRQLGISWFAPATTWTDNLHIAEQLDGNSQGTPYRVKHFSRVPAQ